VAQLDYSLSDVRHGNQSKLGENSQLVDPAKPRPRFFCIALIAIVCYNAPVLSQDKSTAPRSESKPHYELSDGVFQQKGDLPIILSAPHGGIKEVPGVSERTGTGLESGPSGFFTGRDTGTEELAHAVAEAVLKRFGKAPYVVISRVHRKFMDPNRPADVAYEDPNIKPIYDYYHETLSTYCREVTDRYQAGVLIDIHGQGTRRDTVFRGTKNGQTVSHLRATFGEAAHQGPNSLFGLLGARGWTVHPSQANEKEQSGFTGGFIVQSYGNQKASPIDAMQLEFGAEYRVASRRDSTAEVLADALAAYAAQYLKVVIQPN
jgi:N-formylglutamate amidohydrolase